MRILVLGACGTFMGGIAVLARALGHEVTGVDAGTYPPMDRLLAGQGIPVREGYTEAALEPAPDLVLVGNALSRGNPCVEAVLNRGWPYRSGPAWLADEVLRGRHVIAVSGTHGKTTTSALLAWILEAAGQAPGFLVGGMLRNFPATARLGEGAFVVEADEYDTAFFDKRPKFIHYHPETLIINNIEFDHADIFADLAAIRLQFHYLVRTVPGKGQILANAADRETQAVLEMGCWTPVGTFGVGRGDFSVRPLEPDYSAFEVQNPQGQVGRVEWSLFGRHNAENAAAAIAAAARAGVDHETACRAARGFLGVARRLQVLGTPGGVSVYDDFAHHPTAIQATLTALRQRVGRHARIITVLEPRSNSMKLGVGARDLPEALEAADRILVYRPRGLRWDPKEVLASLGDRCLVAEDVQILVDRVAGEARPGDHVLVMSNGGFEGIHQRLLDRLGERR
jgi:UDP-N-acetylmuramate: L-alanyl-gamma-D-glutamyl-meso-diaminopimelate ligase